tara:strand:- start:435 stop:779 length:345 start_codon:yes stop_codon:yes gene_type:complete
MRITLDLPKYKWDDIYNHLKKHIDESENVAALCTAIKMNHYEKSLNSIIYNFLLSHGLNTAELPTTRELKNYKGGPGLIKDIYYIHGISHTEARKQYSTFIKNNFKLVPLEDFQ